MAEMIWERDLATALERAGSERRFVPADFSKDKKLRKAQTILLARLVVDR